MPEHFDVLIVGAGISGIGAAYHLQTECPGKRYVILEGAGHVEVAGQDPVTVGPMDVVNIPAGVPQRITNTGARDLVFLCICTPRFKLRNYLDLES